MTTLKPFVRHIHFSDCTGVDGEGLQVGQGEIDWQEVCEVFSDYEHGWTPEIWNGHHDHGAHFHEAHALLAGEFRRFAESRSAAPARR
jgi:N-acetylneuraminate synthase